jgi:glutamate 5-kinase
MTIESQLEAKRPLVAGLQRVVVKIGSTLLTDPDGLRTTQIETLARELAAIHARGVAVTLVSSGAIAAGRSRLPIGEHPTIPERQAAAAVGQIHLMSAYEEVFSEYGIQVAQILLDADDLASRHRYMNAAHAVETLQQHKILPIVNENDTVSIDELKFGDNDQLSSMVASLVRADLLIILSDVGGMYTANPAREQDAERIPLIARIDAPLLARARGRGSSVATGGMESKLRAARKAATAGIPTIITDGRVTGALARAIDPTCDEGTLILPVGDRLGRREHWIAFSVKPRGSLHLDKGAVIAICEEGRSLLPSGLTALEGRFEAGDCVSLFDPQGQEFARGLASYTSREMASILGKQSGEVEGILGYKMGSSIVHRNDLVLLNSLE